VTGGVDDLNLDIPEGQQRAIFALLDIELICGSGGGGSHHDGDLKFGVAGDVVGVIVSQQNVFKHGLSLGDIMRVFLDIEYWVDDDTLLVGLKVVGENGELCGLELGQIEALAGLLGDDG
jgi:hypothetical protein